MKTYPKIFKKCARGNFGRLRA